MTAWIATTTYIVAMYMQIVDGDVIKAVGQIDPESPYITSYLLPNGEKCSGQITPGGNVVCTIDNKTIYYFVIKEYAKYNAVHTEDIASTKLTK